MLKVNSLFRLATLLVVGTFFSAHADQGKAIYQQCAACHGAQGEGNKALSSPALAGQAESYLIRQLQQYKSGVRGKHPDDSYGMQMAAMSSMLDEDMIKLVSAYLSGMKPPKATKDTSGDEKQGYAYYQGKCGACHGGKAEGNPAFNAPRLAGLSTDYLLRQMQHFQKDVRGTDKNDMYGRQMAMMSRTVSEEQLNDILYFISKQD